MLLTKAREQGLHVCLCAYMLAGVGTVCVCGVHSVCAMPRAPSPRVCDVCMCVFVVSVPSMCALPKAIGSGKDQVPKPIP